MESEEFEACWHAHIRRVVAYAERHVGRDAASDVASSTFLTAWRTWDTVPDEPLPWLISVARGHVRNHLRAVRRRLSLEQRLALLDTAAFAGAGMAISPSARFEALAVLASLPVKDREALLLVAWDGLTTEQAAEVLDCRPGALRMRLVRARERLTSSASASTFELTVARSIQ